MQTITKFSIDSKTLKKVLTEFSKLKKSPYPSLDYVYCWLIGDEFIVKYSNLNVVASAKFKVESHSEATFLVNFKQLKSLCKGQLTFEVSDEVKINDFPVDSIPVSDYPNFTFEDLESESTIHSSDIVEGLHYCGFSASKDPVRMVLNHLHLTINETDIEFASTDGHRMSVLTKPNKDYPSGEYNIHPEVLKLTSAMAKIHNTGMLDIEVYKDFIVFSSENFFVANRRNTDQYPWYWQLIPRNFSFTTGFDRTTLIETIETLKAVSQKKEPILKIELNELNQAIITVHGKGEKVFSQTVEWYTFDKHVFGVNANYLLDVLKRMKSEGVTWAFTTGKHSSVLSGDPGYTHLLMTVEIRD